MSADKDDRKHGLALRLEAMLVREGKEKSRALESKYYGRYGDPANHVEFQFEAQRRRAMKVKRKGER